MQLATVSGSLVWVTPMSVSDVVVSETGVVEVLVQSLPMQVDIVVFSAVLTVCRAFTGCSVFTSHVVKNVYTVDLENFGVKKLRKAHTSTKLKHEIFLL